MDDRPIFVKEPVLNIDKEVPVNEYRVELRRLKFFETIKQNPNSPIYKIAKLTKTNYSQAHQWMRELVFTRLVAVRMGFDSNGESCELFFVPENQKKEGGT